MEIKKRLAVMAMAAMLMTNVAHAAPRPDPICPEGSYADPDYDLALTVTNSRETGIPMLHWQPPYEKSRLHHVYIMEPDSCTYKLVLDTWGARMNHSSAEPGEMYWYMVQACADDTRGELWSKPVKRTCDLPMPRMEVSTKRGYPRLTWRKIDGAKAYQVWYKVPGDGYRLLYTAKGTSLNHRSAKDGQTYTYRVRAIHSNSAANSAYSYTRTARG